MKAKELRIGNRVISKTHNILNATIDGILPNNGIFLLKEVSTYETELEPIPLTPEILEKCGFVVWDDKRTYEKEFENGSKINVKGNEVFLGGYDSCTDGHGFTTEIKYVHQLQNLYFSLTGEELKIKNL